LILTVLELFFAYYYPLVIFNTKVIPVGAPVIDCKLNPKTSPVATFVDQPVKTEEEAIVVELSDGFAEAVIVFEIVGKDKLDFHISRTQVHATSVTIFHDIIVPLYGTCT